MNNKSNKKLTKQFGFSYLDVMVAITIMLMGVLAMASALTANLIRSYETDKRIIAKQTALSTIESIIAARNIKRPGVIDGWDSLANKNAGIFVKGWTPIREDLGWDGVAGTDDDACAASGPCVVSGRPDNDSEVKSGFERKIVIEDIQDPDRPSPPNPFTRRKITVSVRYYINNIIREEEISTLLTNY